MDNENWEVIEDPKQIESLIDNLSNKEFEEHISDNKDALGNEMESDGALLDKLIEESGLVGSVVEEPADDFISKDIGLTAEDIKALYEYVQGKGDKPLFIDRFTADTEGRLKDMTLVMTLCQLSRLPELLTLQTKLQQRLYSDANIKEMSNTSLSNAISSVTSDINKTLSASLSALQTINAMQVPNNEYRKMLDRMLTLPPEVISRIKELIYNE